jgi:hypothetical protein
MAAEDLVPHRGMRQARAGVSSYGASLASYIVQRLSGQALTTTGPARLRAARHAAFDLPAPPAQLVPYMSTDTAASEKPIKFEILGPAPASSLSSPAEDGASRPGTGVSPRLRAMTPRWTR